MILFEDALKSIVSTLKNDFFFSLIVHYFGDSSQSFSPSPKSVLKGSPVFPLPLLSGGVLRVDNISGTLFLLYCCFTDMFQQTNLREKERGREVYWVRKIESERASPKIY